MDAVKFSNFGDNGGQASGQNMVDGLTRKLSLTPLLGQKSQEGNISQIGLSLGEAGQADVAPELVSPGASLDLNRVPVPDINVLIRSPLVSFVAASPEEEERRIAALDDLEDEFLGDRLSDTDKSDSDLDDEVLEENTQMCGEELRDFNQDTGEWYNEEAKSIGDLFGFQKLDNANLKCLLEDLNLNFGSNGKCCKKSRKNGEGSDCEGIREDVVFNGL